MWPTGGLQNIIHAHIVWHTGKEPVLHGICILQKALRMQEVYKGIWVWIFSVQGDRSEHSEKVHSTVKGRLVDEEVLECSKFDLRHCLLVCVSLSHTHKHTHANMHCQNVGVYPNAPFCLVRKAGHGERRKVQGMHWRWGLSTMCEHSQFAPKRFWSYPETRACPHPGLGTQILSLPAKTVEDSIRNWTHFSIELQGLPLHTGWPQYFISCSGLSSVRKDEVG